MTLIDHVLAEAHDDQTLLLGAMLLLTLAVTRALVPKSQRRVSATVLMYAAHLALVPVAGWLRWKAASETAGMLTAVREAAERGIHGDVRLVVLILGAMAGVGMVAQLVFEILLPRIRLPAPRILRDVAVAAASIVAVFAIASRLGFNLSGIIATSAVLTAVIGFSLQDTLGNIMGGMALQLDSSIKVGDWIKVGDLTGRVAEIHWRFTSLETRNWETIIVPNSVLSKVQVTVLGRRAGQPLYWRRWVWFNVGFEHSPTEVIEAVHAALSYAPIEHVAGEPTPSCVLMDLGDSGCRYAVRYWLKHLPADDPTDSQVRARVYFALKRLEIPLCLPAQNVYVHDQSAERDQDASRLEVSRRGRILNQLDMFRELGDDERAHIAESLKYAPFGSGETLTKQGNVAHWLYIIVSGEVSVRVNVDGGTDREVSRLKGPSFVGEMGLLTGEPRSATIVAGSDIECYRLDKTAFHTILQQRPALAGQMAEILTRRKVELEAVREGLSAAAKERRVTESSAQILAGIRDFFGL